VEDQVRALGFDVDRIAGADRYETAALVARRLPTPQAVFLAAGGSSFRYALLAGPAAARAGGVVLLVADSCDRAGTCTAQLPQATRAYLQQHPSLPRYAVGGSAAAVDASATTLGTGYDDAGVEIAQRWFATATEVGVASAANYPDALAAGVFAARHGMPLLFVEPDGPSAVTAAYLQGRASALRTAYVFGGTAAVSDAARDAVFRLVAAS
jgi:hypothetical protein